MKIREMLDQLDEISRRDFIKGAGVGAGLAIAGQGIKSNNDNNSTTGTEQGNSKNIHNVTIGDSPSEVLYQLGSPYDSSSSRSVGPSGRPYTSEIWWYKQDSGKRIMIMFLNDKVYSINK